jgi:hypothetical protein
MRKKRINYKKLTQNEALKLINESLGMSKHNWEKLWRIAHDRRKRK